MIYYRIKDEGVGCFDDVYADLSADTAERVVDEWYQRTLPDDGVFPIKVSLFETVGGPTKEYLVDLILIPRYDVRSLPDEADY